MTEDRTAGTLIHAALEDRALIALTGADVREFLQGIMTNDAALVSERRAVYAALLTPQGKFLHDFMVFQMDGAIWLDCAAARRDDLARRLRMYRLRADVAITDAGGGFAVHALIGPNAAAAAGLPDAEGAAAPFGGGIAMVDPRTADLGVRAVLPAAGAEDAIAAAGATPGALADYDALRIRLGVPDGSRDLEIERSLPLEYGFDELNGVDFEKGCFIGQEVTSRMKRRGLVRKRLMPVVFDGAPPPVGAVVRRGDAEAGEVRAVLDGEGLALLRLDRLEADGPALIADGARIETRRPRWMRA